MNLAVLTQYREQIEEGLRLELAGLDRRLAEAEARFASVQAAADEGARQYLADAAAGVAATEAVGRYDLWVSLNAAIDQARTFVEEARRLRTDKLQEVLAAAREKKQMELLSERAAGVRRREAERREQRDMDEAATVRHRGGQHA